MNLELGATYVIDGEEVVYLGVLGNFYHFRCRNLGASMYFYQSELEQIFEDLGFGLVCEEDA